MSNDENKEIRGVKVSELQGIKAVHIGTFTYENNSGSKDFCEFIRNPDLFIYKADAQPYILFANFKMDTNTPIFMNKRVYTDIKLFSTGDIEVTYTWREEDCLIVENSSSCHSVTARYIAGSNIVIIH